MSLLACLAEETHALCFRSQQPHIFSALILEYHEPGRSEGDADLQAAPAFKLCIT
jgi:hypothetical protein